eukprot:m.75639 g.75639  ORF g.75639 m.75639 type:complete len:889 (+) comp14596_c0_seq1:32-2698(+)
MAAALPSSATRRQGDKSMRYTREQLLSVRPKTCPPFALLPQPVYTLDEMIGLEPVGRLRVPQKLKSFGEVYRLRPANIYALLQIPMPTIRRPTPSQAQGKRVIVIPPRATLMPVKPLETTENAWRPGKKTSNDAVEVMARKAQALLNKLTPERFAKLSREFFEMVNGKDEFLQRSISVVFDKALDEEFFCSVYAQLCEFMIKADTTNSFKPNLLKKCEQEFLRIQSSNRSAATAANTENLPPEEVEYQRVKAKRHLIGYMKFIGELYNLSIITPGVMLKCLTELIQVSETTKEDEMVESTCKLMTTVGPTLEHDKPKELDEMMSRLMTLRMSLPSRIRFMVEGLGELRQHKWQSRRQTDGPMTLAEIKKKAAKGPAGNETRTSQARADAMAPSSNLPRGPTRHAPISILSRDQAGEPQLRPQVTLYRPTQSSASAQPQRQPQQQQPQQTQQQQQPSQQQPSQPQEAAHAADANAETLDAVMDESAGAEEAETFHDGQEEAEAPAQHDPVKVTRLLESTLKEFLDSLDAREAIECVNELSLDSAMGEFFGLICNTYIEMNASKCQALRNLLKAVLKSDKLHNERLREELTKLVDNLADIAVDVPFVSDYAGELIGQVAAFADTDLALELLQLDGAKALSTTAQHKMFCSALKIVFEQAPSEALIMFEALKSHLPTGEQLESLFREFKLSDILEGEDDVFVDAEDGQGEEGAEGEEVVEEEGEAGEPVELMKITESKEMRDTLTAQMTQLLAGADGEQQFNAWATERISEEDQSTAFFVRCLAASIFAAAAQAPSFLDTLKSLCVALSDIVRRRKDLQIGVLLELQQFALSEAGAKYTVTLDKACKILSDARIAQPSVFVQWRNGNLGPLLPYVRNFIAQSELYKDDDQQ